MVFLKHTRFGRHSLLEEETFRALNATSLLEDHLYDATFFGLQPFKRFGTHPLDSTFIRLNKVKSG